MFSVLTAYAQETTFRSQSNVVVVPALVQDKRGNIVYGLHASDFLIDDDGVEQAVQMDESVEPQPISVIVAIQTGGKAYREFPRIRGLDAMLTPILDQPHSQIAVVTFDSQINLVQDFTSNGDQIQAALQNLQSGDGGVAILDAVKYSVALLNKTPEERNRVLLLISEIRDHGSRVAKVDDVVASIGASKVSVYTLVFSPALSNVLDTERGSNRDEMNNSPDLLAALNLALQATRKNTPAAIAAQTGGEYRLFDSRQRFESRMVDFTNHLHSRYLLSFEPNHPRAGFHQIRVRLKQPENRTVLARTSYWASDSAQ